MTFSHDITGEWPPASTNATFPSDGDRMAAMAASQSASTDRGRSAATGSFSSRVSRLPPGTSSTTAMSAGYRALDWPVNRISGQRAPTDDRRRAAASNGASPGERENGSAGSSAPFWKHALPVILGIVPGVYQRRVAVIHRQAIGALLRTVGKPLYPKQRPVPAEGRTDHRAQAFGIREPPASGMAAPLHLPHIAERPAWHGRQPATSECLPDPLPRSHCTASPRSSRRLGRDQLLGRLRAIAETSVNWRISKQAARARRRFLSP
jgi:hypothetical protein